MTISFDIVQNFSSNRTIVELKFNKALIGCLILKPSNRTIVELKFVSRSSIIWFIFFFQSNHSGIEIRGGWLFCG